MFKYKILIFSTFKVFTVLHYNFYPLKATLNEVSGWLDTFWKNKNESPPLTSDSPSLLLRELVTLQIQGRETNSMPVFRRVT